MATTKITQVGKRIVNDSSLIFYYDATNTIRSFKGKPTTNLFTGYVNQYDTWTTSSVEFTYYDPLPEVKMTETSASVGHYVLKDTTLTDNTEYTQSIYVKPVEREHFQITPSTGFTTNAYANFTLTGEGSISGTGASKAKIKLIKTGRYSGWYRCSYTETSSSPGAGRMVYAVVNSASATRLQAYAGTPGSGVLILDPQLEASNFATPFVDGTRSTSQAIIDLTGNETITANSLTYNSDNTFEFGPRTDAAYLDVTNPSYPTVWTDNFTFEIWHYVPSGADWEDTLTFGNGSATALFARGSYQGSIGLGRSDTTTFRHIVRTDSELSNATYIAGFDTWYHLVGTWDGSTNRLYVNGELESSDLVTVSGVPDSGPTRIGGNFAFGGTNGGYAEGETPIARMYSKALSAAEVKQNFIAHRKQFGL